MLLKVDASNRIGERVALRGMFEARKRVFVDLLKWDIPVLDGRYEVDHLDDPHAIYIILTDRECRHLGSARLLPTTRPGLLDTLFPELCDEAPPAGENVYEITRFCLSPDISATERRIVRNQLVTALALFAIDHGIETYTGVAEMGWLKQIMAFGWSCRPLGASCFDGRSMLGALRIDIGADTIASLKRTGIFAESDDGFPSMRAA